LISVFLALAPSALLPDVTSRITSPRAQAPEIQDHSERAEADYDRAVQLAQAETGADWGGAARYYQKSAQVGYAPAQYELARLYVDGLGVERNLKQAAFWYRRAADQSNAEAQNNLGSLYAKGQGVRKSQSQAAHWYGLAAAQNNPEATSNLGVMYLRGRGVRRDPVRAFQLFLRAAQMGYTAAQNNVALMYANGQGVGCDYVWAYAWLELASKGSSGADRLRDEIGKQMTADDIGRAETLAAQKAEEIAKATRQGR
jgi:hypothetical protein